jgi:hypothetical protein
MRDLELDGCTAVPSCGMQERERSNLPDDAGRAAGRSHWGWDRIELRSAGWHICGEGKQSAAVVPMTPGGGPAGCT